MLLADHRRLLHLVWPLTLLIAAFLLCSALSPAGASDQGPAAAGQTETGQENSCCVGGEGDDRPHLLAASYYSFRGGFASRLLLNNKGPRPLEVRPALFSLAGERLDPAPVSVEANSYRVVDMREWVAGAGPQFEEGSVQVFHRGRDLVLGAQVFVADEARSLSFEEKLAEPATFKSSRLEGLWWLPGPRGEVLLAVSNTSDARVSAAVAAAGEKPRRGGQAVLELAPHETRVLDVGRDLAGHAWGAMSQFGGISITHSGRRGAVLARALAQEADAGYSLAVQFSEPAASKSSRLQGAGLRLGRAGGRPLTPVFVARNVGDGDAIVSGRLPFTATDGSAAAVPLPELSLAAGETAVVEAGQAVRDAGLGDGTTYAGVEFEHTGAPGTVLVTALSVGRGGDQVFRVPLWDIHAQRSSTGGYPWFIDGASSTTVYIKNTAVHPQQYFLQLRHSAGVYSVGVKTIDGGQTATYDLRRLRDEQVADAQGEVIPPDAAGGQLHWSKVGPEEGVLIGRSEQADVGSGVSSNYACLNCCDDNPTDPDVTPDTAADAVGGSHVFSATQRYQDCYGGKTGPMPVPDAAWSSSDAAVASVAVGTAVARGPGTATINARWTTQQHYYLPGTLEYDGTGGYGGYGTCEARNITLSATATYKVVGVVIKQGGADVTNGTQNVAVGQKVSLLAEVQPAGTTVTNPQWTVPGTRVANYVVTCTGAADPDGTTPCQSPTSAVVTPLTSLTAAAVDFYWVDGGDNRQVAYSVDVGGARVTGFTTFNVKRPAAQVTARTGAVAVSSAWGPPTLHYGTPTVPGISFTRNVTMPTGGTGSLQWVQVGSILSRRQINSGAWERLAGAGLDDNYPYSFSGATSDSPGSEPLTSSYLKETASDSFQMYLMFKPSAGTTPTIWVPLRVVNWSWAGEATRSGTAWLLTSASNAANPPDADATTHPTWTRNIRHSMWVAGF